MVLEIGEGKIKLDIRAILRDGCSTVYSAQQVYTFKLNATKRLKAGVDQVDTLLYGY